jgi:hypothetical protein
MSANYNCRCCGEFMPSIPRWDQSLGCVCSDCFKNLRIAEQALAEAGVVDTYTGTPQKQGGQP